MLRASKTRTCAEERTRVRVTEIESGKPEAGTIPCYFLPFVVVTLLFSHVTNSNRLLNVLEFCFVDGYLNV